MKALLRICGIVNAAAAISLILFLAVQLPSFGMWFYYWQFDANNTYEVVNMEPHDLHAVTRHMIEYMQGRHDRDYGLQIMTYVGGEARPFFSDIEIRHMVDVYDLFVVGIILRNIMALFFIVSLIPFVWLAFERQFNNTAPRRPWSALLKAWKWGSIGLLALFAALAALIAINWHRAFVIFHEIFFDNEYWQLNPRVDLLVNIVPYDFFITISIFIGAFFVAGLVLMAVLSSILLRRGKSSTFYGRR